MNSMRTTRRMNGSFIVHHFGFTLIELMIAVALMLILMGGVSLIFKTAGQATGAGQVLSQINRDAQAAQTAMQNDFSGIALNDGPAIQIFSGTQPAFRNKADQLSDQDFNATASAAVQATQTL